MNKTQTTKQLSKKDMKIDFEGKVGTFERLKLKIFSLNFLGNIVFKVFRFVLLVGISYIILYPFFTKIMASFMSPDDFVDVTVKLIPRNPTLDQWKFIILENKYFLALFNTTRISVLCALFQTLICAIIGYGFAKFKFKGATFVFFAVILTMLIPHDTLMLAMFMKFRYFDILGILGLFTGGEGLNLLNTEIPVYLLSITGLAFKNGLYIFIFRQFYKGVPDELEEAAYIDGTGVFKTYFQIILPMSTQFMTTVFMFAFSWQWTDTFYTASPFFTTSGQVMLTNIVKVPTSLSIEFAAKTLWESAITNTCGLLVILPLFIVFLFAQRALVEGIERSGIVG